MYGSSKLTFMSQLLTVGLGTFIIKSRGQRELLLELECKRERALELEC